MEYYLSLEEKYVVAADNIQHYPAQAERLIQEILEEDPCYARAHHLLGWSKWYHFNDLQAAEMHYRLALKFDPAYLPTYDNYIYLLWYCREYEKMQSLITKALTVKGINVSMLHEYLTRMYLELQDGKNAKEQVKLAILYNKNDGRESTLNSLKTRVKELRKSTKKSQKKPVKKRKKNNK